MFLWAVHICKATYLIVQEISLEISKTTRLIYLEPCVFAKQNAHMVNYLIIELLKSVVLMGYIHFHQTHPLQ